MQATFSAKSGGQATCVREKTNWALIIIRILTAFAGLMIFFPEVNPGRLMSDINANTSLFTAAISYSTLTDSFARPLRMGWVQPWHFYLIMGGCALLMLGIILSAIGACMSLGNHRMKRAAVKLPLIGSGLSKDGITGDEPHTFHTALQHLRHRPVESVFIHGNGGRKRAPAPSAERGDFLI